MKKWIRFGAAAILALMLCVVSGGLLLACMEPMEDRTYNLSLTWEGESEGAPEDWVYDQKGWTVFIQEGDTATELVPDGFGGFSGLEEPGQTFYFSRVLSEKLDSPTLRLDRADRSFAVFLDGDLLYTDCPELDNRVGYLRLPMWGWSQEEPVLITLPWDYAEKTLTIAQSTNSSGSESQESIMTVWPCNVTLYCGYAYESALVAKSFQTAVPATLTFIAGTLLLTLFAIQSFRGVLDLGSLCGGLIALFWMAGHLALAFLPNIYFGPLPVDIVSLAQDLSLTLLLIFLISRLTGWRRVLLGLSAGVQGAVVALEVAAQITKQLTLTLILTVFTVGLAGLTMAWIFGVLEWKERKSWFFRYFCLLTIAGAVLWAALGYWLFPGSLSEIPGLLIRPLTGIMTAAALVTALMETVRRETARRMEARLLVQRSKLAQNSYEAMRQQHEQVMILRHDMMKHFRLLRQTTGDEKTAAYLDELIGQNKKIRPVVQSGNEILDIILNSKLSAAVDTGITVEIVRMQAPNKLPLSDAELCSLMMNLLDNAMEASVAPEVTRPYIKLDLCVKEHFFVLFCENSTTLEHIQKETTPGRGLGLKIIKEIAARYDNLLETEYGVDYYSVKLAIPLD